MAQEARTVTPGSTLCFCSFLTKGHVAPCEAIGEQGAGSPCLPRKGLEREGVGLWPKEEFQSGTYGCRPPAGGPTRENTCNGVPLMGEGGAGLQCREATVSARMTKAAAVTRVQNGTGSFSSWRPGPE